MSSLSIIFEYIKSFYQQAFKAVYLLVVMGMLGVLIYFNYRQQDINTITAGYTWAGRYTAYYFLFFIPFVLSWILQKLFYRNSGFFRSKWFWMILVAAPAIFAFRVCFNFHQPLLAHFFSGDLLRFWLHCSKWPVGFFVVLIPVYLAWKIKDSDHEPFYGIRPVTRLKPYFLLILVMLPIIVIAAGQAHFQVMYPRARAISSMQLHPKYFFYVLYEIFYSLDFVTIEIFFRGFLIVGLMRTCGMRCIIPAACFYCCVHFGKPMAEAISSFFGGLLLGIIIYHTKSIRGGLLVHLGIAWLMEIAGFIYYST